MFIAFEGPDNVGKSTSALALDCAGQPDYNATKTMHRNNVVDWQGEQLMPHTYDRIDWMTHMVYRLAMPDRDWNDDRPRTVFAMPDTHLVFKIHNPERVASVDNEEGYVMGEPAKANRMYYYFADYFMSLNTILSFSLFKSVSIIQVDHDPIAGFTQRMIAHSSPFIGFSEMAGLALSRLVSTDEDLLALLQDVEQHS